MTLQELSQYYKLRERLRRDEEILESLEEAAGPGSQAFTGMPHAPGIKDKVGDLAVEIADMKQNIELLQAQIAQEEAAIQEFIRTVPDEQMRTILRLRFLRCLTWGMVARLIGGRNSADGVKSVCYRYLSMQSCNAATAVTLAAPPPNVI